MIGSSARKVGLFRVIVVSGRICEHEFADGRLDLRRRLGLRLVATAPVEGAEYSTDSRADSTFPICLCGRTVDSCQVATTVILENAYVELFREGQ